MMKMEMIFNFTEDGKGEISELMEGQNRVLMPWNGR